MTKKKVQYCPVTGKEMFDRRRTAERVAYRQGRRKHQAEKGSVYLCAECGKYHVTHYSYERSRSKRDSDRIKPLRHLKEY